MARVIPEVEGELEARVEALGFELVEVEWAGSARRPVIRVRVDRPDAVPGQTGITVDECARVSRALEAWMDGHPALPERYVLEVSSPGVERPLLRERDFRRFRGNRIAVRGEAPLAGRSRRLEGELMDIDPAEGGRVRMRLDDGDEVVIPREAISRAHLVFSWD
ncbi:MAG: ribosome maturation factor RimP [Longimicrobiales bacterium]|nr:ribosome maturation factor RimP [Longimicrobiales bacterium]